MKPGLILFLILGGAVLLIDTQTPVEYFDWSLYWVLIVIASAKCSVKNIYILLSVYSLFITLGFIITAGYNHTPVFINHTAGILILWLLGYNLITAKKNSLREVKLRQDLQKNQEQFQVIYNRVDDIVFGMDKNWNVTYKNTAADNFGYYFINVGDNFWEKLPDAAGTNLEINFRASMKEQKTISFLYETRHGNLSRILSITAYPSVEGLSIFTKDLTEQINAQRKAKAVNERLVHITERISDAFWAVDRDWNIIYANNKMIQWSGKRKEDIIGKNLWETLPRLKGTPVENNFRKALEEQQTVKFEMQGIYKDNAYLSLIIHPSRDGLTIFSQDITEYKDTRIRLSRALEEKKILMREVHHRVMNSLQLVTSIINLEADSIADEKIRSQMENVANRINNISLVHSKLYKMDGGEAKVNASEYIKEIVMSLSDSYTRANVRVHLELEEISLDFNEAVWLGIVVNEFVTNSYKHAFDSDSDGKISVELYTSNDVNTLIVRDNGKGYQGLELSKNESLGFQLASFLAEQLNGKLHFDGKEGAFHKLEFPVKVS